MRALAFAAAVLVLTGCRGLGAKGTELSYGQVQAIQPGLTADQVTDAFGPPARVDRGADGKVRTMDYAAQDGRGERARLLLEFDGREVIVAKRFTGTVTKP
jgi:outer membrane protein assembly factor BamE (lipoprotein component of BamABCDE complex)